MGHALEFRHGLLLLAAGCLLLCPRVGARVHADASLLFDANAVDESAGGVDCYRIETPAAVYYLEKSGAGLSSLLDREGNDWLSFHPEAGSGAAGEYRGFPNAVHQQAGNYFHPRNQGTEPATTTVDYAGDDRVTISVESHNRLWAGRYDFWPTHCTFTMTRMPAGFRYWVLYEGTPGGQFDADDWWLTSASPAPTSVMTPHEGDIPAPEWIAFGDPRMSRVLVLRHHEDDEHPDRFYQMRKEMTVFGFGRQQLDKFLDRVPQSVSLLLIESSDRDQIERTLQEVAGPAFSGD